jgi:hypothetical protein
MPRPCDGYTLTRLLDSVNISQDIRASDLRTTGIRRGRRERGRRIFGLDRKGSDSPAGGQEPPPRLPAVSGSRRRDQPVGAEEREHLPARIGRGALVIPETHPVEGAVRESHVERVGSPHRLERQPSTAVEKHHKGNGTVSRWATDRDRQQTACRGGVAFLQCVGLKSSRRYRRAMAPGRSIAPRHPRTGGQRIVPS